MSRIYRELSNVTYNAHKSNWNVAYSQLLTSLLYISKFVEYTHKAMDPAMESFLFFLLSLFEKTTTPDVISQTR